MPEIGPDAGKRVMLAGRRTFGRSSKNHDQHSIIPPFCETPPSTLSRKGDSRFLGARCRTTTSDESGRRGDIPRFARHVQLCYVITRRRKAIIGSRQNGLTLKYILSRAYMQRMSIKTGLGPAGMWRSITTHQVNLKSPSYFQIV